jgi:translocation and assembly module TamB
MVWNCRSAAGAAEPRCGHRAQGQRQLQSECDQSDHRGERPACAGQAKIDAELAGTPAAPQARGSLVLSGGEVQDYPRGVRLTNVSANLEADGAQLQLKQFTAHAGTGEITASGTVGLGDGDLPVALQLTAHSARPFASDLLTATIDMNLKISGALRRQLDAVRQRDDRSRGHQHPECPAARRGGAQCRARGQAPAPVSKSPATIVALNLTVAAPRAVFVRGRGLDAEWAAS